MINVLNSLYLNVQNSLYINVINCIDLNELNIIDIYVLVPFIFRCNGTKPVPPKESGLVIYGPDNNTR